jgi:release factor glutamine methyltransferase
VNLKTALLQGVQLLEDARIPAPRLTAEVLLSFALRREREYLYAHPEEELTELGWIHYGRYLHQRLKGMPTQYITGRQEFYGRDFRVTPDVLIPRPETEHAVEACLARLHPGMAAVDVGAGSGAIAATLSLERNMPVFACDISAAALRVAAHNARTLNARVGFVCCDLLAPFAAASIDLVVSNPPYVPLSDSETLQREVRDFEPHVALFGGPTGFEIYERLIAEARRVLKPGGWLVMELGYNSLEPVRRMLAAGWREAEPIPDLTGMPRVMAAQAG